MLKVSQNTFPLKNYQRVQASDSSGSTFAPNNNERIRIVIDPTNIPMFDAHSSYFTCDFTLTNTNCQMRFINDIGCLAIFKNVRIYLGGTLVEELNEYPTLVNFNKKYNRELSQVELDGIEELDGATVCPLNENADSGVGPRTVKLCFRLPTGVLSNLKAQALLASGEMVIELELEEASKCLEPVPTHQLVTDAYKNNANQAQTSSVPYSTPVIGGAGIANGVPFPLTYELSQDAANAGKGSLGNNGYVGFNDVNDCPFAKGMRVKLTSQTAGNANAGERLAFEQTRIDSIAENAVTKVITVTIDAPAPANATVDTRILADDVLRLRIDGYDRAVPATPEEAPRATCSYQLSNVEMHLQVIEPPPQYLASMPRVMAEGGFNFDVPTWVNYRDQSSAGLVSATVEIPVYASRALSIVSVPRKQTYTDFQNDLDGEYSACKAYQWQMGDSGRRAPNRAVDCSIMNTATNRPSQEHLREVAKALGRGTVVRDLRQHKKCFVIGRGLGTHGASQNLAVGGGARLYVDYATALPSGLSHYNYVRHIRTVQVSADGVSVSV